MYGTGNANTLTFYILLFVDMQYGQRISDVDGGITPLCHLLHDRWPVARASDWLQVDACMRKEYKNEIVDERSERVIKYCLIV